jgi:hypothetical protein
MPESSKRSDFNPEGTEFLIQSRQRRDWIRENLPFGKFRAVSLLERLSDLRGSAVKPGFVYFTRPWKES